MKNVCVFSEKSVEIGIEKYEIIDRDSMVKFLKKLIDEVCYGGEKICLESVYPDGYREIDRW